MTTGRLLPSVAFVGVQMLSVTQSVDSRSQLWPIAPKHEHTFAPDADDSRLLHANRPKVAGVHE